MNGDLDQDTAWLERIGAKTPGTETGPEGVVDEEADGAAEVDAVEAETDDDAADDDGADGEDDGADDGGDDDDEHDGDDHDDQQDDEDEDEQDHDDPAGYDLDDYNYRYSEDTLNDDADSDDEGDDVDALEPLGFTRFTAASPDIKFDVEPEDPEPVNRRFTPWVLGGAVAVVAVAALTTTVLANVNTAEPSPTPAALTPVSKRSTPPPAPPPALPPVSDETGDGPIPFTATSDCNPAGSTPAQSVAIPDSPTPWICVIDGPGQVLSIQLGPPGVPQSYVITGITVISGAVGKPGRPPNEPDPWLQHHVVTRIQFGFNDPANTVLPSLNTGNVRGEVPMPVPRLVASHITAIIQETSRPPAPQPTSAETPDSGGVFGGILGPAPASTSAPSLPGADTPGQSDISDRTFAITSIKVIGHRANQ